MKKALAGPAKRTAKKKPERRAMIAAARRRAQARSRGCGWKLDSRVDRGRRTAARARLAAPRPTGRQALGRLGARLRPAGVLLFRGLSALERWLRGRRDWRPGATRASAVLTPQRAICLTDPRLRASWSRPSSSITARSRSASPAMRGCRRRPPLVGVESAGAAHAYLLVPVGAARRRARPAARRKRAQRAGPGRLRPRPVSLAVVLLVDLPGRARRRRPGLALRRGEAVLYERLLRQPPRRADAGRRCSFWLREPRPATMRGRAEHESTYSARAASGLRRRRRRRASSRGRGARRGSRRRNGVASAPASRP